jgi:hypothetical protein
MSEAHADADGSTLIVVRAGATDRFAVLRDAFLPEGVDVVWDRRGGDRRRPAPAPQPAPERRRRERRGIAPASWDLLDFLIVPVRPVASWRDGPAPAGADRSSLTEGIQPGAA